MAPLITPCLIQVLPRRAVPPGAIVTAATSRTWPMRMVRSRPLGSSQIRNDEPSATPSQVASGAMAIALAEAPWLATMAVSLPVAGSQIWIVSTSPPLASQVPSGASHRPEGVEAGLAGVVTAGERLGAGRVAEPQVQDIGGNRVRGRGETSGIRLGDPDRADTGHRVRPRRRCLAATAAVITEVRVRRVGGGDRDPGGGACQAARELSRSTAHRGAAGWNSSASNGPGTLRAQPTAEHPTSHHKS